MEVSLAKFPQFADTSCHVTPLAEGKRWTTEALRDWLAGLRAQSGLTHDELADAVGESSRRQTVRWLKEGHEPNGVALLRILTALGVQFVPPPPPPLRSTNAELRQLRAEIAEALGQPDSFRQRREDLLAELEGEVAHWRALNDELEAELDRAQQANAHNGGS